MINQIIYTSCRTGINNRNSGFQVLSYSDKLDIRDISELERLLSSYKAPIDMIYGQASNDTSQFPQAFLFTILSSGKMCLGLSTYLGHDYMGESGRSGNYMSHFLVFEKNQLKNYPCSYYSSPTLRENLEFEEVNLSEKPDYLPDIEEIQPGHHIDISHIVEFINQDREKIFLSLIAAVLEYNDTSNQIKKKIVLLDEKENVIKWIAAIQYAFPLQSVDRLPFCSYVYSPLISNAIINGVVSSGTSFILGSADNNRYYYIFDCINNSYPQKNNDAGFFKMLEMSFTLSYENLKSFHSFLGEYSYNNIDNEIHDAFSLYQIKNSTNPLLTEDEIFGAIKFEKTYGNANTLSNLLRNISKIQKSVVDKFSIPAKEKLFKSLIEIASNTRDVVPNREFVYRLFIETVFSTISNIQTDESFDEFCSFYDTILHFDQNLIDYVNKSRNHQFVSSLTGLTNIYSNAFYLKHILTNVDLKSGKLDTLNKTDSSYVAIDAIFKNIKPLSIEKTCKCLILVMNELENDIILFFYLHHVSKYFSQNNEIVKCVWKKFSEIMQNSNTLSYDTAYDYFFLYNDEFLTFNLFRNEYKNSSQKSQIFSVHVKKYILKNKRYSNNYALKIFDQRIKSIKLEQETGIKFRELLEVIGFIQVVEIDPNQRRELLLQIISILKLSQPDEDTQKIIEKLSTIDKNLIDPRISPHFYLLYWGLIIERQNKSGKLSLKISEISDHFSIKEIRDIDQKDKVQFLEWILPNLIQSIHQKEDHSQILLNIGRFLNNNSELDQIYINELSKVIEYPQKNLIFYSFMEYCAGESKNDHQFFFSYFVKILSRLSEKKVEALFIDILQQSQKKDELKKYMRILFKEIKEESEKTIIGRIKKIWPK